MDDDRSCTGFPSPAEEYRLPSLDMPSAIGLIDANNFYASVERAFDPALNDRPLVVLSNNDGCVVGRSPEAKLMGIKMGEPIFQVRHLL
jgi:DNA polymerase V